MSAEQVVSIILAVATLVPAVATMIIGILNANKIENVHLSINSRMDQLLAANRVSSHAEGREEARKEAEEQIPPWRNSDDVV